MARGKCARRDCLSAISRIFSSCAAQWWKKTPFGEEAGKNADAVCASFLCTGNTSRPWCVRRSFVLNTVFFRRADPVSSVTPAPHFARGRRAWLSLVLRTGASCFRPSSSLRVRARWSSALSCKRSEDAAQRQPRNPSSVLRSHGSPGTHGRAAAEHGPASHWEAFFGRFPRAFPRPRPELASPVRHTRAPFRVHTVHCLHGQMSDVSEGRLGRQYLRIPVEYSADVGQILPGRLSADVWRSSVLSSQDIQR